MKISRIKEYWHLLEGLKNGQTIQINMGEEWCDIQGDIVEFDGDPEEYRIKPCGIED